MLTLTLSDYQEAGNIPTLEYECTESFATDGFNQINNLLSIRNGEVIVIWRNFDLDVFNLDQHSTETPTFLVTTIKKHATDYCRELICDMCAYYYTDFETDLELNVFCFESYEEAFGYLTELNEGL